MEFLRALLYSQQGRLENTGALVGLELTLNLGKWEGKKQAGGGTAVRRRRPRNNVNSEIICKLIVKKLATWEKQNCSFRNGGKGVSNFWTVL